MRLLDKNAEHGTSEVFVWSGVRIGGVPLKQVASARGVSLEKLREGIERDVRYANIAIIEGNEASQYGIGMRSTLQSTRVPSQSTQVERQPIAAGALNTAPAS